MTHSPPSQKSEPQTVFNTNSAWEMLEGLCLDLQGIDTAASSISPLEDSPTLQKALSRMAEFLGARSASLYQGDSICGFQLIAKLPKNKHLPTSTGGQASNPAPQQISESGLMIAAQEEAAALFLPRVEEYKRDNGLRPSSSKAARGDSAILLPIAFGTDKNGKITSGVLNFCELNRPIPAPNSTEGEAIVHASHMIGNFLKLQGALGQLKNKAACDSLTGLFNYATFYELLSREAFRCQRYKAPMSLILIDIDHFKQFNDQYGHLAGDQILSEIGIRIRKLLRASDIPARYGGDELALILPETDLQGACRLAHRIQHQVNSEAFYYLQTPLSVSLSIGVAEYRDGIAAVDLVAKADKQLYRAKELGRNQVAY